MGFKDKKPNNCFNLTAKKKWEQRMAAIEKVKESGNKMRDFLITWADCLDGVQMCHADFVNESGIKDWREAIAAFEDEKSAECAMIECRK